jgi:hypothetical protein
MSDVVNFADLAKEAEGAFEPVPVGTYECVVNSAELKAASTGKNMYALTYKIQDGPHAGRILFNNVTISPDNPNAMRMFFKNMLAMGIGRDFWDSNPSLGSVCGMLEGAPVVVTIAHKEWAGEMREDVKRLAKSQSVRTSMPGSGGAIPNIPMPASAVAPGVPNVPAPTPAPVATPEPQAQTPSPPPTPDVVNNPPTTQNEAATAATPPPAPSNVPPPLPF